VVEKRQIRVAVEREPVRRDPPRICTPTAPIFLSPTHTPVFKGTRP
jgi:hypothetical protein